MKMEEFKVDKLGWYEDENKERFKILHISEKYDVILAMNESEEFVNLNKDGYREDMFHRIKLIKYLGAEIPKKPREFEFEGYIFEDKNGHIYDSDNQYALDKNFGYPVSPLCVLDESKHSSFNFRPGINRSKWKVHMKEILDE